MALKERRPAVPPGDGQKAEGGRGEGEGKETRNGDGRKRREGMEGEEEEGEARLETLQKRTTAARPDYRTSRRVPSLIISGGLGNVRE